VGEGEEGGEGGRACERAAPLGLHGGRIAPRGENRVREEARREGGNGREEEGDAVDAPERGRREEGAVHGLGVAERAVGEGEEAAGAEVFAGGPEGGREEPARAPERPQDEAEEDGDEGAGGSLDREEGEGRGGVVSEDPGAGERVAGDSEGRAR